MRKVQPFGKCLQIKLASRFQHAFSHLQLVYPKDELTVARLLEIAIEGERYEHNTMYPGFEKVAREEARLKL